MRVVRALSVTAVLTLIVFLTTSGGRAQGPATQFFGIGDLGGGGTGSAVRDATRTADGTIYAVGASASVSTGGVPQLDTPALWTWAGSGPGALTALPPGTGVATNAVLNNPLSAYAITPLATFIASQARSSTSGSGTNWVRVTVGLIPNATANLNLSAPPGTPAFAALALSANGDVVYGQRQNGTGGFPTETRVPARYEPDTGRANLVDLTPTGKTWGYPVPRGTSSDGLIMVGYAANGFVTTSLTGIDGISVLYSNTVAFRYVHNAGTTTGTTTPIPLLRNDSIAWNMPVALSGDGNQTLMIGNSDAFPNGEVYLTDANNNITSILGSPNLALMPRALGGMTGDGSVVAVTFSTDPAPAGQISGVQLPAPATRYAYVRNNHGWFHFSSVLADRGVDLVAMGWDPANMIITGIRTVEGKDLVFGQGRRRSLGVNPTTGVFGFLNGAVEGFVAELPAGVMAAFNPAPTAPEDESIVGVWAVGTDPNNPGSLVIYMADGTFYFISASAPGTSAAGFERGAYHWAGNSAGGALVYKTAYDTNGTSGLSGQNGYLGRTLTISGNTGTFVDTNCVGCPAILPLTRVAGNAASIVGGWIGSWPPETPGDPETRIALVLLDSGKSFIAYDGPESDGAGTEVGTYTWNPTTHQLIFDSVDVNTATLSRDELGLTVVDGDGHSTFTFTRIVAPSSVVPSITNATLSATGEEDSPFSYQVQATNALTFSSPNLPAGLSIDASTGLISGSAAVNGTFNVTLVATNTFGATDSQTLVLTLAGPTQAHFYGIGDLPGSGGVGSASRDATRVNGTLYSVGASTVNATAIAPNFPRLDTPALWTYSGGPTGTLQALPNDTGVTNTNITDRSSYVVTPDGTFLAGQSQPVGSTGTNWVRVTRSLLPGSSANLNLNLGTGAAGFANLAMSDAGSVHYGQRQINGGLPAETRVPTRYEIGVGASFPGLTVTGKSWGVPVPRGTSTDGRVMVGMASNGGAQLSAVSGPNGPATVANTVAFRYVHNTGTLTGTTAVIPFLPNGGTWNMPVALTPLGTQTVVIGDSASYRNGEVYLTNAANTITETLGSPNTALTPRPLGGITADGVIAVTFANSVSFGPGQIAGLGIPSGGRYAYIHNSHGWFPLSSALAAQGVNLVAQGWDPSNFAVTGVRTVEGVDLVVGQGRRRTPGATGYVNGDLEGFVAELPAGALAAFNPTPAQPSDPSIVGTWLVGTNLANPQVVVSYLADGTFVRINFDAAGNALGFERGSYTWAGNALGGAFVTTTSYDTDGTTGVSSRNGQLGLSTIVTGDTFTFTDTNCPGCAAATATRLVGSAGSVVGSWITPYPAGTDFQLVVLTGPSVGSKYYLAGHDSGGGGTEVGTYTWDSASHVLVTTETGGNPDSATTTVTLRRDELGVTVVINELDGNVFTLDFTRIVAPSLVQPAFTGSSSIDGVVGFGFSFTPATVYAASINASGLPGGLGINSATGEISGTPTTAGSFPVLLTAGNIFGASTQTTLTINITAPAVIVMPPAGGNDVVVEPEVPPGTPDVVLTFDNVAPGGGETTVAVIDPETTPELAPEPPANFQVVLTDGGVPLYYDIHTTATITGPTTICFSYAGVDFGGQTPRLFHYVDGDWVDITSSIDEVTQTLCGTTTSFSPFAIFKSTAKFMKGAGFYAPVSPIEGFVNTAKAGSTVPLKFNVTLNGVEKTDTTDLFFSTAQLPSSVCSASPQDQVDYVSAGETNLRYDTQAKQFIQNWKLPKTTGCVLVRITYGQGDQEIVLLTATFSLK